MSHRRPTRRDVLKGGVAALAPLGLAAPAFAGRASRPNLLFIVCDQMLIDAFSARGCPHVATPNLDRLVRRGMSFTESHSTSPVCSPARSSMFTSRMPVETGVVTNSRPIHERLPTMGHHLRRAGYETFYFGKWHLPLGHPNAIDGFTVWPSGYGQGDLVDTVVSRNAETFLRTRRGGDPFLLVASFLQPHDICYWCIHPELLTPEAVPFPIDPADLPPLPPNHAARPAAPERLARSTFEQFNEQQWRYYLYVYYRQIEMLDAEVGRLLDALDETGLVENTLVVFTADHGEGAGRHSLVSKWYAYEESVKVPLVIAGPGVSARGAVDRTHLVTGLDLLPTLADFAGIDPPAGALGRSLRPLLEGRRVEWREFVVAEVQHVGRMIRTERYKYVEYPGDPVVQLFDMREDPWETRNLAVDGGADELVGDHRRRLHDWLGRLEVVEPTPVRLG